MKYSLASMAGGVLLFVLISSISICVFLQIRVSSTEGGCVFQRQFHINGQKLKQGCFLAQPQKK